MNQPLPLTADGLTDRGVQRETNEDFWGGPLPNLTPELAAAKGYLYVVADGVGGHRGGEVASRIAVQVTQQVYYADPNPDVGASLTAAIQEANRRIYHQGIGSPDRFGMSTTITAAVVRGDELVVANVGDSRAYLVRSGRARQLTVDHTWVEEQRRAKVLTDEEAADHPQRNVITRSLGGKLDVRVDVFRERLTPGDALLLCTDGLSDLVTPQEIAGVVGQSRNPGAAVRRLVDLAKNRGAPDNVTAVVVSAERRKTGPGPVSSNFVALAGILGAVALVGVLALWLGEHRPGPAASATATPALTPSPMMTVTPTPAATNTLLPTPELIEPTDGFKFPFRDRGKVILSWRWVALQPNQRFRVKLWDETRRQKVRLPQQGVTRASSLTLPDLRPATYRWTVLVEREVEGEWEMVARAGEWTFVVQRRPTPTLPPTPTPTKTPAPTPPPESGQPSACQPGPLTDCPCKNKTCCQWDSKDCQWKCKPGCR